MQSLRFLFPLVFLLVLSQAHGQSLIGTWQLESKSTGGEGRNDCYVFRADKTFEYRVNTFGGLNRLVALGGTYRQGKGYLALTPTYTREVVGSYLTRSHITTGNDSWSFEGGTAQKRAIAKPIVQSLEIVFIGKTAFTVDQNGRGLNLLRLVRAFYLHVHFAA